MDQDYLMGLLVEVDRLKAAIAGKAEFSEGHPAGISQDLADAWEGLYQAKRALALAISKLQEEE